uniref:Pirin C-terminal domain-containing protein n=1 Tax=Grammatophora oceanica TaxID=210454 RepID=A0A7S1VIS5_9STRA
MFDIEGWNERQELFQLWLNVPSQYKMDAPQVNLLGTNECPVIKGDSTETIVLAGSHGGIDSGAPSVSSVGIYHVKLLESGAKWEHELPSDHYNAILYVRQGNVKVGGSTNVDPHHTAFLKSNGSRLVVEAGGGPADFILLTGAPLNEPVAAQGSMVMNTQSEIQTAYGDYQLGRMGLPWNEKLSDEDWRKHVRQNPSAYTYTEQSNVDSFE